MFVEIDISKIRGGKGNPWKPCLCYYPCYNGNCPKEKGTVCHINHCEIVRKYSQLTYNKKYCPECGRKLKGD